MTEAGYLSTDNFNGWPDDAARQVPGGTDGTYELPLPRIPRGAGHAGRVAVANTVPDMPPVQAS